MDFTEKAIELGKVAVNKAGKICYGGAYGAGIAADDAKCRVLYRKLGKIYYEKIADEDEQDEDFLSLLIDMDEMMEKKDYYQERQKSCLANMTNDDYSVSDKAKMYLNVNKLAAQLAALNLGIFNLQVKIGETYYDTLFDGKEPHAEAAGIVSKLDDILVHQELMNEGFYYSFESLNHKK